MGSITLEHVNKSFGDHAVIPDASLEIEDGAFVVFVGPSGCGKSTLLKTFAVAFVVIWLRVAYPRLREDQLQRFAWKFLIPLSLVNIMATAVFKVVL